MANSVEPVQIGSALFAETYLSWYLGIVMTVLGQMKSFCVSGSAFNPLTLKYFIEILTKIHSLLH